MMCLFVFDPYFYTVSGDVPVSVLFYSASREVRSIMPPIFTETPFSMSFSPSKKNKNEKGRSSYPKARKAYTGIHYRSGSGTRTLYFIGTRFPCMHSFIVIVSPSALYLSRLLA